MLPILHSKTDETCELSLAKILPNIGHFFAVNKFRFALDLTLCAIIGNYFLIIASYEALFSALQLLYVFIASVLLFRATAFMHEAYHQTKNMKWFQNYYNLVHGFLHKIPSYGYDDHRFHHSPQTYGTRKDPEYETLGSKPKLLVMFLPLFGMLLFAVFIAFRWVLIPFLLPFIGAKGRNLIYRYASTFAMCPQYVRDEPTESERLTWYQQDFGCALYTLATAALIYSGVLPTQILVVWVITLYFIALINFYRVALNHRYFTEFDQTTHKGQVLDSVTLPLTIFNAMFYPLGLGYHALHHMFPQIPYHNMGKVHNYLMENLPPDHPYRATCVKNYLSGFNQLLNKKF